MSAIVLGLSSGREIVVTKVMLYPAELVEEAARLRAQAMSKMGHTSTGIGFLGSPGWAVAGALAVGALESAINNKNHQEGASILEIATKKWLKAKANSELIDVKDILNADQPTPSSWRAVFDRQEHINFSGMTENQISETCSTYGLDRRKIFKEAGVFSDFKLLQETEVAQWIAEFVYGGEEFMAVEVGGEVIHIKWNDVTTYKFVAIGEA